MNEDPVRAETRDLAAQLAQRPARSARPVLGGPPPRVASPPASASPESTVVSNLGRDQPLEAPPAAGEVVIRQPEDMPPVEGARRSRSTDRRMKEADRARPARLTQNPVNVVLTVAAADLLTAARHAGATPRVVIIDAVRQAIGELHRRHPPDRDPSGPIPRMRTTARRHHAGHAVNVAVRFYPAERAALDQIAEETELSLSGLVTEALTIALGGRAGPNPPATP